MTVGGGTAKEDGRAALGNGATESMTLECVVARPVRLSPIVATRWNHSSSHVLGVFCEQATRCPSPRPAVRNEVRWLPGAGGYRGQPGSDVFPGRPRLDAAVRLRRAGVFTVNERHRADRRRGVRDRRARPDQLSSASKRASCILPARKFVISRCLARLSAFLARRSSAVRFVSSMTSDQGRIPQLSVTLFKAEPRLQTGLWRCCRFRTVRENPYG